MSKIYQCVVPVAAKDKIHNHMQERLGHFWFNDVSGKYRGRSPQLTSRLHLLNRIKSVCNARKLSTLTLHLAVHLLDFFMDKHDIYDQEQLEPVGISCLLLAAKLEEMDDHLPSRAEITHLFGCTVPSSRKNFHALEKFILEFYNWDLNIPTSAYFVELYSTFALTSRDEVALKESFHNALKQLLDAKLDCEELISEIPTITAAAIISVARKEILGLSKAWPEELEEFTTITERDLSEARQVLLEHIGFVVQPQGRNEPTADSPDSGVGV